MQSLLLGGQSLLSTSGRLTHTWRAPPADGTPLPLCESCQCCHPVPALPLPCLCSAGLLKVPLQSLALQPGLGATQDSPAQNGNATAWRIQRRIPSASLLPLSQCFLRCDSLETGLGTWSSILVPYLCGMELHFFLECPAISFSLRTHRHPLFPQGCWHGPAVCFPPFFPPFFPLFL